MPQKVNLNRGDAGLVLARTVDRDKGKVVANGTVSFRAENGTLEKMI